MEFEENTPEQYEDTVQYEVHQQEDCTTVQYEDSTTQYNVDSIEYIDQENIDNLYPIYHI